MSLFPAEGNGLVHVRLSAVPLNIRIDVAQKIIDRGRLPAFEALDLMMRARHPVEDPALPVSREKADRVIRDGKVPLGDLPKVWNW